MVKRCSFDFDDTLSLPIVQLYVKELIAKGIEVWLCTSRYNDIVSKRLLIGTISNNSVNSDLHYICGLVGIPENRRLFTNGDYKADFFNANDYDFLFHLDNDEGEVSYSKTDCNIPFVLIEEGWQDKCNKLLNL